MDDGSDYVSMHHRVRRSIRRRLKLLSVETEKPVTDLVNEAIQGLLERAVAQSPASLDRFGVMSAGELVKHLQEARKRGDFVSVVASLSKEKIVEALHALRIPADRRLSGDRLFSLLDGAID